MALGEKKEKSVGIMHSFPKRVKGIATRDCGMAAGALCYRKSGGYPDPQREGRVRWRCLAGDV